MSIRFSLQQSWKIVLFASICVICASALIYQAVLVAGSEELGELGSISQLQRAAALWPRNPEIHYQIGLLRLYTFGAIDRADAIKQMREATQLGPQRAAYWRGLAWACESVSDTSCADQATKRVRALAPMDPQALWFAGNYYLRAHQPELAMERFVILLRSTPSYDRYVFRICDSLGCPEAEAKRLFTESGPQIELDYISYLANRGDIDTAYQLWAGFAASAIQHGFSFSVASIEQFVNALLERGRGREMRVVWSDLEKLKIVQDEQSTTGNLVFNGDFERPVSDSGLDWRLPEVHYATVDTAAGMAYHGTRCLRVDFTVNRNDSYLLAYQWVPVDPNTNYRLTAYTHSEEITSDSGPHIQVIDPLCPACLHASSGSTLGTTDWHRIEIKFSTGPRTELARIQVVRLPSRTYPMDITGVFWLDDVTLKAEKGEIPQAGESDHRRSAGLVN